MTPSHGIRRWIRDWRITAVAAVLAILFIALAIFAAHTWRAAWSDMGPDFTPTQFLFSVGFSVAALIVVALHLVRRGSFREAITERWISIGTGVLCLTATFLFSLVVLAKERRDARTSADAIAESVAGQIQGELNASVLAITHMAHRMENATELRQVEWEADAQNYLRDLPGLTGLARLDNGSVVRWVMPRFAQKYVGRPYDEDPIRRRILERTRDANQTLVSPALELLIGGAGIIVTSPVRRADESSGFLVGAFHMHDIWKSVLASAGVKGYRIVVLEGERPVYESAPGSAQYHEPVGRAFARLPGLVWTIRAQPPAEYSVPDGYSLVLAILFGGSTVSVLLTLSMVLAQAARHRAGESELVKRQLESEIRERRKYEEVISENEERFRLAFGGAPIGMALVTREGRWLRVNDSLCRMLGYSPAELLATDFQSLTHPDDLNADLQQLAQVLSGEIGSYSMDKRYFHKQGHIVYASLHVAFVKDKPGTPGYFVSQIMDISQRIEMDRVKREFISTVSHELRTPLTSIAGSLELVAGGIAGELPPGGRQLVEIAERNSRRLVRLIDDILYIDKAAAGKLRFELQLQPLVPIVRQAIEANLEYAAGFGVQLELKPVLRDAVVRVDRDRLIQVLTNLISNGAKFSAPGSQVILRVELRLEPEGLPGRAFVFVQDRGSGIPEAFRSRIFQQFAQADSQEVRNKGGTGLGLSIAKVFIERLGGSIGYDTAEGHGSTFYISLPIERSG